MQRTDAKGVGRRCLWVLAALVILSFQVAQAASPTVETHRYLETTQDLRQVIDWRLERHQGYLLTASMPDDLSVCHIDAGYATQRWDVRRPGQDTRVTARRAGTRIHLSGEIDGAVVARTLEIDSAPWYQACSLSLRAFATSSAAETYFWILRPEKFTAHKLQARRNGIASIEIAGRPVDAHTVTVGLIGWKAPFWSATYWFRVGDGLFLRYRGASGPPGSPETVVEWLPAADGDPPPAS